VSRDVASTVVAELQLDAEVLPPEKLHDSLQVVA
jgi:hypothetical protein